MTPTFGDGKICYLEIPAEDCMASAQFYRESFGWQIRENSDGNLSFDDAVGEVSGMWVTGRLAQTRIGLLVSIMVYDIQQSLDRVVAAGGSVLEAPDPESPYPLARIADPYGNVFCLYQHRQR